MKDDFSDFNLLKFCNAINYLKSPAYNPYLIDKILYKFTKPKRPLSDSNIGPILPL